jgi:hypothetical protein
MTQFVITNVLDEIEEWRSQYGDFMYSVVAFAGKEMIKATKKDRDKALLIQGLLKESVGISRELVVEPAGTSKAGNPKWKLISMALGPVSSNGHSSPNGHRDLLDGRAIALQAAAVWAQGREWEEFETAFGRMYGLLAGISTESHTEMEASPNGQG